MAGIHKSFEEAIAISTLEVLYENGTLQHPEKSKLKELKVKSVLAVNLISSNVIMHEFNSNVIMDHAKT